jgi:hypothetical protein
MPIVIFDTSVFISYKAKLKAIPESCFVSIVVIQELMAGARDNSELSCSKEIREYRQTSRADY